MSLGSLVVSLAANISEFTADLGKAAHISAKTMETMKRDAERAGKAIGLMFAAGAATATLLTKRSLDSADAIYKMSQSAGVSTEALSALKYAADLSGVSTEQLGVSMSRLNRAIAETASGTGEAMKAFNLLGINVKRADGSLKSADEVLTEVAIRFERMEDGASKSALAIEIFGRAGAQMIPMLNQGAAGLANAKYEAEQFGKIISADTAKAAEELNDNLRRLTGLSESFGNAMMIAVLPNLNALTEAFVRSAKDGEAFKSTAESIVEALKMIQSFINHVVHGTERLGIGLAYLADVKDVVFSFDSLEERARKLTAAAMSAATGFADAQKKFDMFNDAIKSGSVVVTQFKDNWELLGNTWKTKGPVMADKRQFEEQLVALRSFVDQYAAAIKLSNILTGEAEKQGLITHVQAIEQRMAADNAYLQTLQIQLLKQAAIYKQMGEIAKERKARDEAAAAGAAVETNAVIAQAQIATFEELERQKSAAKAKEEQKRLAEGVAAMQIEFLTEREFLAMHLQQKQEMLNAAFENQQISAQEHARLMEEIELRHRDKLGEIAAQFEVKRRNFTEMTWQQQTDTVAGAFQQMTAISGRESRKMFEINKIASLAIAIVKGWEFVMSSAAWGAAWGGVYGGIAAGSIAAAVAAANVAAISRTQFGGGQVASFAGSTPVTPVQQSGPDIARERGPDTIIQLRGDVFSREGVRKLIEQLNETTEDGGRITVV